MKTRRLPYKSWRKMDINEKQLRKCFSQASAHASSIGYDWQIAYEDWLNLIKLPCHYCGNMEKAKSGSSLDRIDNTKGYLLTNVLPCCTECNRSRMDHYTSEEFRVMRLALTNYRNNSKIADEEFFWKKSFQIQRDAANDALQRQASEIQEFRSKINEMKKLNEEIANLLLSCSAPKS